MILLNKPYRGYTAGTIVQLNTSMESALIAQGFGVTSVGPVTAGAVSTDMQSGRVGIAAAGTSVVLTNPNITAETKVWAQLSNLSGDTTATSIRVTPAVGSVTFTLNAAATAVVAIDWALILSAGETVLN